MAAKNGYLNNMNRASSREKESVQGSETEISQTNSLEKNVTEMGEVNIGSVSSEASASNVANSDAAKSNEAEFVNQDELIRAQEQQIADEIKANTLMIGPKMDLGKLQLEFANDKVYLRKVEKLSSQYSHLRRTRPDGNCFLRGFLFSYLEYCVNNKDELKRFKQFITESKDELLQLGFPKFTTEDFHDTFVGVLGDLEKNGSLEQVEAVVNDEGTSNYLVVYLRLLISAHLQKNADFFSFFIEGGRTVEEFCKLEVAPMYVECDHLHIVALTAALAVPVCVIYMDRGDSDTAAAHLFPEDASRPFIHLLYKPGHYDILYKAGAASSAN